jgi:hypothetical protein
MKAANGSRTVLLRAFVINTPAKASKGPRGRGLPFRPNSPIFAENLLEVNHVGELEKVLVQPSFSLRQDLPHQLRRCQCSSAYRTDHPGMQAIQSLDILHACRVQTVASASSHNSKNKPVNSYLAPPGRGKRGRHCRRDGVSCLAGVGRLVYLQFRASC